MTERDIFIRAFEAPDPAARRAYLDRACGGDSRLRERVEGLLGKAHDAGNFLERPAVLELDTATLDRTWDQSGPPATGPVAPTGATVGPYRLVEVLGEGGMGTVYLAEQTDPVKRRVALKLIRPGMDSESVLVRFEAERQALALMDHPHIAKVLDAGTADGGRPFFVMELVPGPPLTRYCDDQRLTLRERVKLFVPVCRAVQHAHQKGVIHRDLKPSNILVADVDGKPVPKVIDFGVAKATAQRLTEKTLVTVLGAVIGTPEYMSPEQAEPGQVDVDTRSDVYSLGVILYELLTGTTPLDRRRVRDAALLEVLRLIREEEPPRPSARLNAAGGAPAVAAARGADGRQLCTLVRGDLDWIVMKCLEKDRARRYETASDLARDVEHYLADEPVLARPPSGGYRLRKFLRRNRGPVLAAAGLAALVLGSLAVTLVSNYRINRALNDRTAAYQDLERAQEKTADALARESGLKTRVTEALAAERREANINRLALADRELSLSHISEVHRLLDECPEEARHWEWHYLKRRCHREERTLAVRANHGARVAFGAGGRWLATADNEVKVWDPDTGELVRAFGRQDMAIMALAVSADGRWVAHPASDGTLRLYDADTGEPVRSFRGPEDVTEFAVAFSPDGRRVAAATGPRKPRGQFTSTILVWDVSAGQEVVRVPDHPGYVRALAFTPDGRRIASATRETVVHLWDVETGQEASRVRAYSVVNAMAFDPTGARLALAKGNGETTIHGVRNDTTMFFLGAFNREGVSAVAFSPDGQYVATGDPTGAVSVWSLSRNGYRVNTLLGHSKQVFGLAYSPDGQRLASSSLDGTVKLWRPLDRPEATTVSIMRAWCDCGLGFRRDGKLMTVGRRMGEMETPRQPRVGALDPRSGALDPNFGDPEGKVVRLAVDARGERVATLRNDSSVSVRDALDGKELFSLPAPPTKRFFVALSPGGQFLAIANAQRSVEVWEVSSKQQTARFDAAFGVTALAFSPDGNRLALAGMGGGLLPTFYNRYLPADRAGRVQVCGVSGGGDRLDLTFPGEELGTVAFSPDGNTLAVGGMPAVLRVCDARTGRERLCLRGQARAIVGVAFSPDGRRLAAGCADNVVRIYDTGDGREMLALREHQSGVQSVAFSLDGHFLATASHDTTVKIWDATPLSDAPGRSAPARRVPAADAPRE